MGRPAADENPDTTRVRARDDIAREVRASSYTGTIGKKICEMIADGASLRGLCRELKIDTTTVLDWLQRYESFREMYRKARVDQADALADEIMDVARQEPGRDEMGKVDSGDVQHRRLLADVLKWRAAKLKPQVYGDKITQEHTGQGGQPLVLNIVTGVPVAPTPPAIEHDETPRVEAPPVHDEDAE